MTGLIPALCGMLIIGGVLGLIQGLRKTPPPPPSKGPSRPRIPLIGHKLHAPSRQMKIALAVGVAIGALITLVTGWFLALIVIPAAILGVPYLLAKPPATGELERLNALEEWTRSLSGVLSVGVGLEETIIATEKSTPAPIKPEVTRLVQRLHARWRTEDALRAFADDLNDPTGDVIALNLMRGASRQGDGLAAVLTSLAEAVAAEVAGRRDVESDRAKPRSTARMVTLISAAVLGMVLLTGSYFEPYGSPLGQIILGIYLAAYAAALIWLRSMAATPPAPRILSLAKQEKA